MRKVFSFLLLSAIAVGAANAEITKNTLINTDFSNSGDALNVWGAAHPTSSVEGGACALTVSTAGNSWEAQAAIGSANAIPIGSPVVMKFKAKATAAYTLNSNIQNPTTYANCGSFPSAALTTEYQSFELKTVCDGENAKNILLNFGNFEGTITIDDMEVVYYDLNGEKLTNLLNATSIKNNTAAYATQMFINLPTSKMTAGKKYFVKLYAKSTAAINIGSEFIDDVQTEHMTEWNASAVFNYCEAHDLTSEFKPYAFTSEGKTTVTCHKHCTTKSTYEGAAADVHKNGTTDNCDAEVIENFEYIPTALILNIGNLPLGETLTIGDIQLFDEDWQFITNIELSSVAEYDKSKSVYYPGWQAGAKFGIESLMNEYKVDGTTTLSSSDILDLSSLSTIKAYTAAYDATKAVVKLTQNSTIVPAGTGLVLSGSGTACIPVRISNEVAVENNQLVAVLKATDAMAAGTNYVLAKKKSDNTTAFYKYTGDATPLVNKAYLNIPASDASEIYIEFEGEEGNATSINTVETEAAAQSFDLNGRKMNGNGLQVRNGRVVFVK